MPIMINTTQNYYPKLKPISYKTHKTHTQLSKALPFGPIYPLNNRLQDLLRTVDARNSLKEETSRSDEKKWNSCLFRLFCSKSLLFFQCESIATKQLIPSQYLNFGMIHRYIRLNFKALNRLYIRLRGNIQLKYVWLCIFLIYNIITLMQ